MKRWISLFSSYSYEYCSAVLCCDTNIKYQKKKKKNIVVLFLFLCCVFFPFVCCLLEWRRRRKKDQIFLFHVLRAIVLPKHKRFMETIKRKFIYMCTCDCVDCSFSFLFRLFRSLFLFSVPFAIKLCMEWPTWSL